MHVELQHISNELNKTLDKLYGMSSNQAKGGLHWILGKTFFMEWVVNIGTG